MRLSTLLAAPALAAALYAGSRPVGPLPPLGPLLDPANGVWAAARPPARGLAAPIPGLSAPVDIRYDQRGVPHIFARTEDDAYRALGYVVARDRLFQLDLQTRAASGRLAEILGARAVALDSEPRLLGMPRAAERKLGAVAPGSPARRMIDAYAAGVNAWIDQLAPADWPIEYRLLGARPERWAPVNSVHLFNRMGYTLAYTTTEFTRLRAAALVGQAAAEAIFPTSSPLQEPIQPNGDGKPRIERARLAPPGAPDSAAARAIALLPGPALPGDDEGRRGFASNNWAVAPRRTANGHALLAGDPHLALSLPSIWYEAHLVVPGALDVYGVTIPGAPGIVIGFNRDVAWTFTNTGADVLDFYRETVDDSAAPTRYLLDGRWRPVERRAESYRGPGGRLLHTDTVRYTHRGPMRRGGGGWLSMRWTILEPSREIEAFARAARARTARELQDAMARDYFAPAQNMLAADRGGTIAIRSTGRFPVRPGGGDGLVIRDGATAASDWEGFWPVSAYPQAVSPAQGFLASANQQPIDPRVSPAYLGPDVQFDPWRALRINQLLRADSAVTPDAMRRYQTDPGSARADLFVPAFLRAAGGAARDRGRPPVAGAEALLGDTAAALLGQWDRRYTRENERAVLFEAAMRELVDRVWDELRPGDGSDRAATPSTAVLAQLLADSASAWWDDRRTGEREARDDVLRESLVAGYRAVVRDHGPPEAGGWRWSQVRHANVPHLLGIPAFSALAIPVQGGRGTLNPSFGDGVHGASWRMVVELGAQVRAWGIYPGGQSGNPASAEYTDRLARWSAGELDELIVPRSAAELGPERTSRTLTLTPFR